jgi:hypothetical protein
MSKAVDESTTVALEWWDGVTGMWAQAGEFDTRDEAVARAAELDHENEPWSWEPAVWRLVTTTVEAIAPSGVPVPVCDNAGHDHFNADRSAPCVCDDCGLPTHYDSGIDQWVHDGDDVDCFLIPTRPSGASPCYIGEAI